MRGTLYGDDNEQALMAAGQAWLRDTFPGQQPTLPGQQPTRRPAGAAARNAAVVATPPTGGAVPISGGPEGIRRAALAIERENSALAIDRQSGATRRQLDAYGPGAHSADGSGGAVIIGASDRDRLNRQIEVDSLRNDARLTSGRRSRGFEVAAQQLEAGNQAREVATEATQAANARALAADATTRRGQDLDASTALAIENQRGAAARDVASLNADSRVDAAEARAEAQRIALSVRGAGGGAPAGYRWAADGTLAAIPGGPADPKRKAAEPLNESQSKALDFGSRMLMADKLLDDLAAAGVSAPSLGQQMTGGQGKLGMAADALASPAQQQVGQARRAFINSVLRRESGAVISDAEFENANRQYFPMPGDSEAVIAQKRANRQTATRGILADVPNADERVRSILGDGYAVPKQAQESPELAELRRRAANNPQLAERLRAMGY